MKAVGRILLDLFWVLLVIPVVATGAYAFLMAYRTYHPRMLKARKQPAQFDMPCEEVQIPVHQALALSGWLIRSEASNHTVVIAHEWGSTKATKLRYAKFVYEMGYNVLLFDLRNHGDSGQDSGWLRMSDRFTDDFQAAIRYVRNHPELAGGRVGALSFSFATWPSLYSVSRRETPVDALILDSGPALNIGATMFRFLNKYGMRMVPALFQGPLLFRALSGVYVAAALWMLGVKWPAPFQQVRMPVLFVSSTGDDVIPWSEVRPIAEQVPHSSTWVLDGVAHLQAFRVRGEEYRRRVREFLEECLGKAEKSAAKGQAMPGKE